MRDPVDGVAGKAMPGARCLGALEPRWLGACVLVPGPWLASQVGQEPRPELERVVDWEPKAWASPKALSGGYAMPMLGKVPSLEGARERTRWV